MSVSAFILLLLNSKILSLHEELVDRYPERSEVSLLTAFVEDSTLAVNCPIKVLRSPSSLLAAYCSSKAVLLSLTLTVEPLVTVTTLGVELKMMLFLILSLS